ncbi:MAG: tRNA uridine-5-carboxymethylaminomethyl(34) synthesis GTPase MnmE [Hyphomicrobiales bacterium]|nr:tRNA uridine-5-carboxymethylaminomethyl(34) synthesis GTPase MnmE [Hyphomicrobiales bacterium]MCP5000524.1 tRNA uridine-5-carboxymethylaminomethyl(34) synthesis GTPase MnmE [Hyphomicrobiales bacterium]
MERRRHYRDTVFALSSGAGLAGVAVIRISGPGVRSGLEIMAGRVPEPRRAVLTSIRDKQGRVLDRGLVLFFDGPGSFTGEDVAELHIHGGQAVIEATLRSLADLNGFRSAEPGEFTRRAFDNGKMDLTEVEGLADLIAAETEMQRRMALEQSSGSLSRLYDSWRQQLIRVRAMIEADFDFADEEDVPGSVADTIWPSVVDLSNEIRIHLDAAHAGEIVRDGYRVVIVGAPNAGKSSLLNALAKRDVAIVSEEQGTTRDILEVRLDIDGFPVIVFDTAGLRENAGTIETEGIRRALEAAGKADLVLLLEDLASPEDVAGIPDGTAMAMRIGTKADLAHPEPGNEYDCLISVKRPDGLNDLLDMLRQQVMRAAVTRVRTLPNRQRHREYLEDCVHHIVEAVENDSEPLELRSENLRRAGDALGRLTGKIDVEDLLDLIFGEFCIGK